MEKLVNKAIYLDSPTVAALKQVYPFLETGIFSGVDIPILLKTRPANWIQLPFIRPPKTVDLRITLRSTGHHFPVEEGGIVFYPYNSPTNTNATTNRKVSHVSILHGESNKAASTRPVARLYDYICVAGPLAKIRYLQNKIFSPAEVEGGRLIMMGDSFVQEFPWIRPANRDQGEEGALLYCPTWEGYGNTTNNYSSTVEQRGFHAACAIAAKLDIKKIIIKPHPYLGLMQSHFLAKFVKGVRVVQKNGFVVRLALQGASIPLRTVVRIALPSITRQDETKVQPIRLGLCDISGMEAVFLKQGIAHMVLISSQQEYSILNDIYAQKAIYCGNKPEVNAVDYFDNAALIDARHRKIVFGWQDPKIEKMSDFQRNKWLTQYVGQNPYWEPKI